MSDDPFSSDSTNPYAPGNTNPDTAFETSAAQPLRQLSRPTSATVFGALNIAMGVLGICGVGGGFVQLMIPPNMLQPPGSPPNPVVTVMENNPGLKIFQIATLTISLITTVMLIIAGLGLLNDKRYGRTLSIYYSLISIIMLIIGTIGTYVLLVQPLLEMASQMPAGPEKVAATFGAVAGIVGSCFGAVYPIFLLVFMMRKSIVDYYNSTNK
ncbi:MAG: hypothetical protein JNL58_11665 [Planctomyces sp.]|nr:hypothetical protein [Planctomyces sp.]